MKISIREFTKNKYKRDSMQDVRRENFEIGV